MPKELFPIGAPSITKGQPHCDDCGKTLFDVHQEWYRDGGKSFDRDYKFLLDRALPEDFVDAYLNSLKDKKPAVVVDIFGATARAMRGLKERYDIAEFKAGVVSLWDHRESGEVKEDDEHGISILAGDLRGNETWNKLTEWLGDDKADLILEFGDEHFMFMPNRQSFYKVVLGRLWDMLEYKGLMVIQTPGPEALGRLGIDVGGWIGRLQTEGIFAQYTPDYYVPDGNASFMFDIIATKKSGYGLLTLKKEGSRILAE